MFQLPTRLLSRSLLTVAFALAGCGGTEMAEDETLMSSEAQSDDAAQIEAAACGSCDNCVLHARCRQPGLPFGLTTYAQKKAIINSASARAGCVAIIPSSSSYGHVAYVERVDTAPNPNRIYLREANWAAGQCTGRNGTKAGLNIEGFWCP